MSQGGFPYMTISSGSGRGTHMSTKKMKVLPMLKQFYLDTAKWCTQISFCIILSVCTFIFFFFKGIIWVHLLPWQDIIPVITGNERLWHSHKINAQWQNLCSKASTVSFVKCPPPHPQSKRSNINNRDYKNNNELCHSCTCKRWAFCEVKRLMDQMDRKGSKKKKKWPVLWFYRSE